MTLSAHQFEQSLLLYGSNLDHWPEDLQVDALRIAAEPAMQALIIQHQYLEEMMLSNENIEPASPELVQRILRHARINHTPRFNPMEWLGALFVDFRLPQPAYVIATLMLLGVGAGISEPDALNPASLSEQFAFIDDGAPL